MSTNALTISRADSAAESEAGHSGFGQLLRSEWTKFRTVRGWVIGMIIAAILMVFLGLTIAGGGTIGCSNGNGFSQTGKACLPYVPHGPGGEVVTDSFNFAHQPLTGNGTITVRVISLTGAHSNLGGGHPAQVGSGLVAGLTPWSKAGIIIKQNLHQGSAYAAMMVTGSNGVRMQYNYTGDIAGMPGKVSSSDPRWLRLTRSGDTISGYDSTDGTHWTHVGTVQLAGLPATVQVGLFATSPNYFVTNNSFGGSSNAIGNSQATGAFDHLTATGTPAGGKWVDTQVGGGGPMGSGPPPGAPAGFGPGGNGSSGFTAAGGTYTLTGSGDIAPVAPGPGSNLPTATLQQSLAGAFLALIVIVVVASMFFTAEYRRGLIRTTLAATPRRGAVLAAKAVVAFCVTFVVGLVAAAIAVTIGSHIEANNGQVVLPVSALTELRVVVGTAAMLGVAAVFAVAIGAVLRRSAAAITIAIVTVVLPFLLAALNVFPADIGDWLLRVTPAAGLAVEQSIPNYHQVISPVNPLVGYYPLSPLGGFAVICAWAAAALALALYVLRRRDV
jgi:ABC-type transport system involved in multi-copper enzyme maturation permease subunit/regulation of enolase protein 1 (concanavalin A-like superfamily)